MLSPRTQARLVRYFLQHLDWQKQPEEPVVHGLAAGQVSSPNRSGYQYLSVWSTVRVFCPQLLMKMLVSVQHTLCMRFGAAPLFIVAAGSNFMRNKLNDL